MITGATGRVVLVVLGLLLMLTYLLLRGSTPDAVLYDQRLRAIDALVFNQAALHRDVLRASHGLLLNYDPLVAETTRLREIAEELRSAGAKGSLLDSIAAGLDEQEVMLEDFKAAHALLRNSQAYFAHLSRSLGTPTSQADKDAAVMTGRLAISMLRFVGNSSDGAATPEVAALLHELSTLAAPAGIQTDIDTLHAHGDLILKTLPTVEQILRRLLTTSISEQARALQDHFIAEHRRAEALAGVFRILLYLASVLLVIYLGYLLARFGQALLQRSEAFNRLAASEARYRAVVDTQTEFIARITPDGRLSFVSDAYCRYFGRSREKLLGRRFNEFTLTVPEDRERDQLHLRSLTPEHPSATIELRRELPDGSVRWVQWADTAVFDAKGQLLELQSVGRDVTDRVAAEARFLAAAETLRDGLAIFDAEDRLVYHNRRYPEHQMANVRAVLALGKRYQDLLRDALALGPIHHPDMGADFPQRRVEMRKQPYSEHEQHLADGRWVLVREGRMADGGLVLVTSDITERRALGAELRQAEKLKAVGTLASGIAHDFNNILATIYTATEVAMLHLPKESPAGPALERVLAAGNRARQLIAEILTFSRSERTPRVAIDVGATVASAIDFCRHALTPSIELRADLPADPVYIAADESQIHQIVSNLCLNAAQAMPDGGRISVRLESDRARDGQRWAKLRVADTGTGMDAETAARAFEPFFTTKPVGEGTGLGLAVVHGTVQALGGRIRLRTAPGRGSVFTITVPRIARTSPPHLAQVEGTPAGHGRTVLLVEPDAEVAEAVTAMLRGASYRVTRHTTGPTALEAFSASRHTMLLVAALSPGAAATGIELASALRQLAPGLGVVFLASAALTAEELAAAAALPATVVTKPVLRRELAAALVAQVTRSRETLQPHRTAS